MLFKPDLSGTPMSTMYGIHVFRGMTLASTGIQSVRRAVFSAKLETSITTDHISPAGAISPDSPCGSDYCDHTV
jgi:aconitate hydratase